VRCDSAVHAGCRDPAASLALPMHNRIHYTRRDSLAPQRVFGDDHDNDRIADLLDPYASFLVGRVPPL
jgi:hypothetical protein